MRLALLTKRITVWLSGLAGSMEYGPNEVQAPDQQMLGHVPAVPGGEGLPDRHPQPRGRLAGNRPQHPSWPAPDADRRIH